ncbi:MAG: hypothetical protein RL722_2759 [Pseudomonadota bacterium]
MSLGLQDLALFSLTVLVLNATPGVDLIFTLTRTLQQGVRAGLAAAAGINAGCVVHALGATFGMAALLAASPVAFTALKLMGAIYLAWLAFGMLRQALDTRPAAAVNQPLPKDGGPAGAAASQPDLAAIFAQGLLTNVLNPKVALFFLALLPQFIAADAPDKSVAFLALGVWFVAQSTAFLVAFVFLVAPLRHWQPGPWVKRGLGVASGLTFFGLAARLALAQAR